MRSAILQPRGLTVFACALLAFLVVPLELRADGWRPWQKVKGSEIAWHYRWNSAWGDYDIELKNGYDYPVSLKFTVSCGGDAITGFWQLQPGAVGSFLERFPHASPGAQLSLRIVESERQE